MIMVAGYERIKENEYWRSDEGKVKLLSPPNLPNQWFKNNSNTMRDSPLCHASCTLLHPCENVSDSCRVLSTLFLILSLVYM